MSKPAARIGGHMLSEIGPYSVDSLTDRQDGPYAAQFTVAWPPAKRPRWLTLQADVDVTVAGRPRWAGYVSDINWNDGTITCEGVIREGETPPALTTGGVTTSQPRAGAQYASAQGWISWTNLAALPTDNVVSTGTTESLNTLAALNEAWASEHQATIRVDARRRVNVVSNSTGAGPKWYVLPQAGVLGVTEDALARTMVGRWLDATSARQTSIQGSGRPVQGVDLTQLGPIDSTRVANVLGGMLAKVGVLYGWTEGISIGRSQIITPGGVHPHLSKPVAGDLVRILGQRNTHGQAVSYDVTVGESIWKPGGYDGGTLDLNPVNLAPRDLASVIEAGGGEAA